jgi:hypothetical protein
VPQWYESLPKDELWFRYSLPLNRFILRRNLEMNRQLCVRNSAWCEASILPCPEGGGRRMLDTTAGTRAVATANGVEEMDVVVKAGKPVRLNFSCQMGVLRGRLVVES